MRRKKTPRKYSNVASARVRHVAARVLVERHGHDPVGRVEGLLDGVAVVYVHVDVQNALKPSASPNLLIKIINCFVLFFSVGRTYVRSSRMARTTSFT